MAAHAVSLHADVHRMTHNIVLLERQPQEYASRGYPGKRHQPRKADAGLGNHTSADKAWLQSGHLNNIVVEFLQARAIASSARWEFPIGYAGSGVDDDMWLDKTYLRQLICQIGAPDDSIAFIGSFSAPIPAGRPCPVSQTPRFFQPVGLGATGGNRHRHRPHDGRRDVLEVVPCSPPNRSIREIPAAPGDQRDGTGGRVKATNRSARMHSRRLRHQNGFSLRLLQAAHQD